MTACIAKAATGVRCLEKASLSLYSFVYHRQFCFLRAPQPIGQSRVEDTKLTLAVIPLQMGVNNSLFCFSVINNTRTILPSFRSCKNYNSLDPLMIYKLFRIYNSAKLFPYVFNSKDFLRSCLPFF